MPVYPGVTQAVYGDAPVTAGRHGYMPVGPRLRPGVTLHYKFRMKTWSLGCRAMHRFQMHLRLDEEI